MPIGKTPLISNPYNRNKYEAKYLNHYECYECGYEWEDAYNCSVDDECPDCGVSSVSPHTTEDHPDFDGVISDVEVYLNNPDPLNRFEYDEHEDNGKRVFTVDINEQQLDPSLG